MATTRSLPPMPRLPHGTQWPTEQLTIDSLRPLLIAKLPAVKIIAKVRATTRPRSDTGATTKDRHGNGGGGGGTYPSTKHSHGHAGLCRGHDDRHDCADGADGQDGMPLLRPPLHAPRRLHHSSDSGSHVSLSLPLSRGANRHHKQTQQHHHHRGSRDGSDGSTRRKQTPIKVHSDRWKAELARPSGSASAASANSRSVGAAAPHAPPFEAAATAADASPNNALPRNPVNEPRHVASTETLAAAAAAAASSIAPTTTRTDDVPAQAAEHEDPATVFSITISEEPEERTADEPPCTVKPEDAQAAPSPTKTAASRSPNLKLSIAPPANHRPKSARQEILASVDFVSMATSPSKTTLGSAFDDQSVQRGGSISGAATLGSGQGLLTGQGRSPSRRPSMILSAAMTTPTGLSSSLTGGSSGQRGTLGLAAALAASPTSPVSRHGSIATAAAGTDRQVLRMMQQHEHTLLVQDPYHTVVSVPPTPISPTGDRGPADLRSFHLPSTNSTTNRLKALPYAIATATGAGASSGVGVGVGASYTTASADITNSSDALQTSMDTIPSNRAAAQSTDDYLCTRSYYNRPKEVQPYCHVPKGAAGEQMGWRKAQKESLAWEARWDPPVIHHVVLSRAKARLRHADHVHGRVGTRLGTRHHGDESAMGLGGGGSGSGSGDLGLESGSADQKTSPIAHYFMGNRSSGGGGGMAQVPGTAPAAAAAASAAGSDTRSPLPAAFSPLGNRKADPRSGNGGSSSSGDGSGTRSGKAPMTAPASNFFLPSIAAAAKPYPYPERQEISHLDEEFIANVLSTQPPPSSHNHDMRGYSRQSPTADHNASAPGQGQQPGQQSGQPGSGTADISAFDLTAQSESAYKTLPPTRSGPTSLALLETGGLRAFVVNSMATSTPLSHELDELDLKLQICELTQREKLFIQDLEKLLKRENVKDERTRKLRKKHVARVFRRLHERVVQLVEAQSDVTGLSKIRREQMERFLEASKKNLIFLETIGEGDPWPEMERQFQQMSKQLLKTVA